MEEEAIKDAIQATSSDFPDIELIYLFGSQISGYIGPMRDIDLGVLISRGCDPLFIQTELTHRLRKALDKDHIDVIILNKAPIELAYAVIGQGLLIYQLDDVTRVEYEAYVMSRHGDYLPILRAQRTDILQGDPNETRVQRYRETFRQTERTINEIRSNKR